MKWLKYYREKMGMSQKTLAMSVGVKENTVWRWENEKATPSVDIAKTLAEIFHISESELLNGPASQTWELRVVYKREMEGDVVDVTGASCNAELVVGERGMAVKLDAPYEVWGDDGKFEDLIADLRRKRETGLKSRKEGW